MNEGTVASRLAKGTVAVRSADSADRTERPAKPTTARVTVPVALEAITALILYGGQVSFRTSVACWCIKENVIASCLTELQTPEVIVIRPSVTVRTPV